mgnify:CR=1 FL=1
MLHHLRVFEGFLANLVNSLKVHTLLGNDNGGSQSGGGKGQQKRLGVHGKKQE